MGKTVLIQHTFQSPELRDDYYTFFVDIYPTKSLREFVFSLSKTIVESLKPRGQRAIETFLKYIRSLQTGCTGTAGWSNPGSQQP